MSKKLLGKLLSVIICLAICCATLCGSIVGANAAAADYNGTYTISVGDNKQAVPFAATEVKAQVKFDLPAGFVGGQFTAKAQSNYTIGDGVSTVAATKKDGTALTADELNTVGVVTRANGNDKDIRFVIGDGVLCTSITLEYTLKITDYVNNGNTNQYFVAIDVDGANFGVEGDYADVTFTATADSDSWFHSHSAWCGLSNAIIDSTANGKHSIAASVCHLCKTVGNLDANEYTYLHIIPDHSEFEGVTTPTIADGATEKSPTAWLGITAANIRYEDNGSLKVDIHAYSHWRSGDNDKVILIVCDQTGKELYRTSNVKDGTSSLAGNGFPAKEKMFTIENLSARDIIDQDTGKEKKLYITAVEYSTGVIEHSRTVEFCLADYCKNVVEGNAVWTNNATDEQIEADKDLAAALYYYGASIDESVFDKNTNTGSDIEYVNANYDEWDGTKVQPTATDSEGNVIINTAEELAWVALSGGSATSGNNYKVAANSVFNMMGMDGITLGSTASQVKAAVKNDSYKWQTATDDKTAAFKGNFDGNGLIVYNLYTAKGRGYSGLFPVTTPATASTPQVIKNVAVYASHIGGYHYAGGIVGLAECNTTSSIVNFEGCVVKNSYIYDNDDANTVCSRTVGSIAGGLSHNGFTLNNCAAVDNQLSAQGIIGGFVGDKSAYGGSITIKNSLSIGTAVKPTAAAKTPSSKFDSATLTNVHTEDVAAATLGSAWFDTETYPELSMFHKLSKTYVDASTHKVICVLKAGDNTCGLKGITEEHTLVKNDEGTAKVCECGYSVPVYGDIEYIAANYDEWDGTKVQPTATDSEGNVIINTAEELAWIALQGGDATKNTNYKVAANSVFNLKGMEGITMNSTAVQVKSANKDTTRNWVSGNVFYGNFDGNGLIAYNVCGDGKGSYPYSGLFPRTNKATNGDNTTIKNVMVRSSYFTGYGYVGGLVGVVDAPGTSCTAIIENCAVVNCYMSDNNNSNLNTERTVSTIAGGVSHNKTTLTNCIALNNEVVSSNIQGGLIGDTSGYASAGSISNSIVIGSSLKSEDLMTTDTKGIENAMKNTTYTNVHTTDVDAATLGSAWFDTATYPELSIFHTMADEYVDETSHKPVCIITINGANCTVCGVSEEHTLAKNAEKNRMECSCGYYEDLIGNTVTPNNTNYDEWDGTKVQPTATDSEGNVIINTAEELAWIALEGGSATNGVNYKVKANSVFNLKGMDGITLNSTVAEVQAATKTWQMRWIMANDSATTNAFGGNFDGNGLTVYNASAGAGSGQGYTGLFPVTRQSADGLTQEIKNVQVVASYFVGYHNAGAVIGLANAPGTSCITNLSNIMVKNCYVTDNANTNAACQRTAGTVVGNVGHNKTTLNNCIVINTNTVGTNIQGGFIANSSLYSKGVTINNSLIIGNTTKPVDNLDDGRNIETPAANATLTNVHTEDVDAATLGSAWFDTTTYPELSIFHDMITVYIDANTHQSVCQHFINGTQCSTVAPTATHTMIDAEDGKSASCECGYSYEIKGIHAMGLPTSILDRITSNSVYTNKFATNSLFKNAYNEDVYGTDTIENVFDMYTTSLNLKVNPHIGFMFAFHGDYKTDRSNITVTFTVDGETYTTEAVETTGSLGTNWVNNNGAGRYHLYRFKELPISKLCKDITVNVNYNGNSYYFGTYSAAGYAINAMNAGEDYQYHVNASMALVYYSEMLAARQGK